MVLNPGWGATVFLFDFSRISVRMTGVLGLERETSIMAKHLNERSFEHSCRNGTNFFSDRCDFRTNVRVEVPRDISREALMQDVSEMIGYHAMNIFPQLNGFQGYDTIIFQFTS